VTGFGTAARNRRKFLVPKVGLEPTPSCLDRILSPARLPFRHFGLLAYQQFTSTVGAVNAGGSSGPSGIRPLESRLVEIVSLTVSFHRDVAFRGGGVGWNET
jgi:hypothetical protein